MPDFRAENGRMRLDRGAGQGIFGKDAWLGVLYVIVLAAAFGAALAVLGLIGG